MMNVLHVADKLSLGGSSIHGPTRLFSWWIPRFDKSRYNVSLCCLREKDKAGEYLEKENIKVMYLGRGKFDPLTLMDLIKIIKDNKINILHLHGYGSTTFGRIAAILIGIPCIVHEHMFDKGIPFYQKWMDCFLGRITNHAIAVSESVKDFLVDYRAIPAKNVRVIYNGVPLEIFREGNAIMKDWKSSLNIPESHKLVAVIGRLHPIKGHRYFLEAAKQILSKYKDVTFLVVGDGDLLSALQEQSRNLGITANVIFMGYCDDVPSLLHEIDIEVISSLSEGVPLTLFEAITAGCAVIASDVGGLGEVIKDGESGFLVPSKNPKALAERILLLLNDKTLLHTIKSRAKEVSHKYNISNTVQKLEEYYEDILHKS